MSRILFIIKKYLKDGIYILLIIICLSLSVYNFFEKNTNTPDLSLINPVNSEDNSSDDNSEDKKIFSVDIKGAIKKPGVYQVEEGTIINEVVVKAGGFTTNAYKNNINLSKKVTDEMVIYAFTKNEMKEKNNTLIETACKEQEYLICDNETNKESIIESNNDPNTKPNETTPNITESPTNNEPENKEPDLININTASKEELTKLSGVGASKAETIIEYRSKNGAFKKIEDIKNVSGIGDALFAKIKDHITV